MRVNSLSMTHFKFSSFSDLSPQEKEALFQLRHDVFVVEQVCEYQDKDGLDIQALHCLGTGSQDNLLCAYARIFPPTNETPSIRIGRIVVPKSHRGTGLGREVMAACLKFCQEKWSSVPIHLSAQVYVRKFYESFGFYAHGPEYLEDDMPHIAMTLKNERTNVDLT
ncbi:MAG: GNAT family N-acetyltransferase [bacterium]|nr:GNAT family N-acetyltransferase [bacterium]